MRQKEHHDRERLKTADSVTLRQATRSGQFQGQTAGLAAGRLQANLAILPEVHALDFMRFCQRNPKPCPLVGVSETGDPWLRTLGHDIDIRHDVSAYNIYCNGKLDATVTDIADYWRDDLVTFALGCSFTFEHSLVAAGIGLGHVHGENTVPMFRSSIDTVTAGAFGGKMVVSMRAISTDQVDQAVSISRRFPLAHGAPVHIGNPAAIGISDVYNPDWGDAPPDIGEKIPLFWACGVTPQNALMRAALPLSITHKPGHMLVTDVDEQAEVPIVNNPLEPGGDG